MTFRLLSTAAGIIGGQTDSLSDPSSELFVAAWRIATRWSRDPGHRPVHRRAGDETVTPGNWAASGLLARLIDWIG
jgi:hypothetical protein